MNSYVIVGNGTAAAACIEGIRSVDKNGGITVVSEEERGAYCRPLISYYLEGKVRPENMSYRDGDFYSRMGCRVLLGRKAVKIDKAGRRLLLDDGTELPYSKLCVASGSSPSVPPVEGLDKVKRRHCFMTMADALALEKDLDKDSRVLIAGAGLIGLKCAEGIAARAAEVTVFDIAERILPSILDEECAALMQSHLEKNGIRFLLGDSAAGFEEGLAHMKSGKTIGFDVLITALGVRPNAGLIKDAGGKTGRGISVDSHMRTSEEDIYAAGDCTESLDVSSGQIKVMALMPNAYIQGHAAGVNMAGGEETVDRSIPMNSIGFFGLHAMTAGTAEGEAFTDRTEDGIRKLYIKDDLLKGYMLVGCTDRAGIYTSIIRERIPLSSLDLDMLKLAATTAAFSAQTRRKMFGGVV